MSKVTFKGISIENLGPFRECQHLDLSVTKGKPIILIKALNGSGKTTLLTALQVALYGNKALGIGRNSDYEDLIRGLQRVDATGPARIQLDLLIETGAGKETLSLMRQWQPTVQRLNEYIEVLRDGELDDQLTLEWADYIDGILPAELLQLFLFDGEKIESLANPRNLPEMLKRATESFFGIGGIDALAKDLVAVERRTLLQAKDMSADYEQAKSEFESLTEQFKKAEEDSAKLAQKVAQGEREVEVAQAAFSTYEAQARRQGVDAFEKAGEIRAREDLARESVKAASAKVRDALSDPYLPLATLGDLWTQYKTQTTQERETRAAKLLAAEIKKHDARLLRAMDKSKVAAEATAEVKALLEQEQRRYKLAADAPLILAEAPAADAVEEKIRHSLGNFKSAYQSQSAAREELERLERQSAAIPSKERIGEVLGDLAARSALVSRAEAELAQNREALTEMTSRKTYLETRLSTARDRMSRDFRGQELDAKSVQAAQRTRAVLVNFKLKLLASKAEWLSETITTEFRGLLRKQRLINRVLVEPETYAVSIMANDGSLLPMERLSAGERQLLAIAVLSALIRERKGRFPVVVDTPLARLDRTHRKALIQRFFATVSHQVMVLSTDEEVEGEVLEEMQRFTKSSYQIQFLDSERRSEMGELEEVA